jgi:5-formyltetrahydrofolate cyclo-ligase
MNFMVLEKSTSLKLNKYQIYEPINSQKIDPYVLEVCFTPLLAFDLLGHRVGYGKGFYDRFFTTCKKDLIKIGLSFFDPIEKIENTHKEDVPLDICVSPSKNYVFTHS